SFFFFFFSSRRRHTRSYGDWSSDVCSSDLACVAAATQALVKQFAEVIIAPRLTPEALRVLGTKANLRVLEVPLARDAQAHDFKRSEERRVGKECRAGEARGEEKENEWDTDV